MTSMMSSLSAPKHSASTRDVSGTLKNAVPSAAKENREKGAQCRLRLQNRNVLQNCPEKPLNGLRKNTIDTNDVKSGKKLPRSSVSNVNNRRFSTGSFNQNFLRKLDRKMDTKFKKAARTEENPLNATFCLPCSDGKRVGNKSLDMVLVQKCLPNIDATSSVPEQELTPSGCSPHLPTEPVNLTSFVAEECLHIAARLSNKSKTCPVNIPDALNQCPVSNVSVITEEPMPFDCSVSYCSDSSPAKSPLAGCTSELPGSSLKDTRCQLFNIELKTKDSSFSDKTEGKYIDSETLPFPSGNLIQFDDTMVLSDPNDLEGNAPCVARLEAYSRNVVSQSPTVNNCSPSLGTEDLLTLDGAMVLNGTSTMSSNNEFPDKSAIPAKTLSNLKLSLSKTDLLLCEGSMLTDEILAVPKQSVCFGNELQKPTALTDPEQSLTPGDLIQLNEAMTLTGKNTTFDASKHETSFGNDLPASVLPNFKMSMSAKDAVQLNGTMTVFDRNATFDTSKHEGCLGNDDKTTASTSCNLSPSTRSECQSNDIVAGHDSKNATFDTSKHECNLGHDPNNPPSTGDKVQLNETMTLDQKNTTFDASKHECNFRNDPNNPPSTGDKVQLNETMTMDQKNTTFDASKHECNFRNDPNNPPSTGDKVQLNETMTMDQKNATFDASKHECNLGNDTNKAADLEKNEDGNTTKLPSCKPFPSGGSNDLRPLNSKSLKLVRKCEGSALISVTQLQGIEHNGESNNSKDTNTTVNFGKDDSKCSIKSEADQGNDGDISNSTELHKGPSDLINSPYLRDSMQKEELNVCASTDLVHDAMSSEWAPYCMSTPNVAMKLSFLEYPPLDHSFQTSSSTLQDTTRIAIADCPDKQVSKDDSNSGSNENETKSSSRKIINAPRLKEQLQKTKAVTASSSKPISILPVARRKNVNLPAVSQEDKCSGDKKSIPLPGRTTRPSSSHEGRRGRPPIQPPNLPKSHLVLGRPSSVVGTGQSAASNELPSGQMGVDTKVPAKVITRIPGIKKRSPQATSKEPIQESKKSDSKLVQLFNLGMANPPNANRSAHKPLVSDSKNIVTGIKRPLEQKRQCPSPKRPKAVGEVSAKLPKKSGTKLLPPAEPKHKRGVKGTEKLTSEPNVNMNIGSVVESESKQEQDMAKLQRRIKELEEKIVMLELENAALRQKQGLATGI